MVQSKTPIHTTWETNTKVLQINLRSDFGGGPHHMHQLIKNLSDKVEIFAAMPKDEPYWELNKNLIGASNCLELPHRKLNLSSLIALTAFSKKNKIDLIHAQGKGASMYGRLLAMFTGLPCVYTFHGLHYGKYNSFQKGIYFAIENFLALFTKTFVAVSQGELIEASKLIPLAKNKIKLIPNGVDIPSLQKNLPSFDTQITICCIARLDYQKNLDLLLPIASGLMKVFPTKKIIINVVGVENTENDLKLAIQKAGLSDTIILQGFTNQTSFWLDNSHFYLSTSRWEGMPLSVLEASAHGLPIIATDVIGNRDAVINDETGFLYPLNKPDVAINAIQRLVEDSSLYLSISEKGHQMSKTKFSVSEMANATKDLYKELLSKQP